MFVRVLTEFLFLAWSHELKACLVNQRVADLLGQSAGALVGRPVLELARDYWREEAVARSALDLLHGAILESFRARAVLEVHGRPAVPMQVWARAVQTGAGVWGVAVAAPRPDPAQTPDRALDIGRAVDRVLLAVVDEEWRVLAIGDDVRSIFGVPGAEIIGSSLLQWVDARDHAALGDRSVGAVPLDVLLRPSSGDPLPASMLSTGQPGTDGVRVYAIAPHEDVKKALTPGTLPRGFHHLTAADRQRIDHIASVTDRQWEVLSLLMMGMTPMEIAEQLYLSPSTVRNHLSAMFDRFGVRNQHELLRLIGTIA